ncbi:anthranilate phosphoribosyltransferase [Mycobacterium xenopi 4042]|uniref:Anthranilate phosphoribosyltransferase n=1 Tax=Mycobacterium xenopi 4042 TaxID=1299334 RepID=X7ZXD3_MYCXE|nr:anthranilate phosphoribosyltransferase [Mycobacterium xenopi 4042]
MTGAATPRRSRLSGGADDEAADPAEVGELADVMLRHARRLPPVSAPTRSTWSVPAVTGSAPSTCRRWRRSWWRRRRAGGQTRQPAASSLAGGADTLEALGVRIDLGPDEVARSVADVGIGFCFAPTFHPSYRYASAVRREVGVPTVFNLLGR